MIGKILNRFSLNSRLATNFFYLSSVQVISLLIPLLVTPYLIKVLGLQLFGMITFSQSIMMLLSIIGEFGFNVSATRSISIHREDSMELNAIFSRVISSKMVLLFVSFGLLLILMLFGKINSDKLFYFSSFLIVLGQVFLPTWFFQGMEIMKEFSIINVAGKILYIIAIFVFIKTPADFLWVNIFWGASFLVSTIVAITFIRLRYRISFSIVSIQTILSELKSGLHLFISLIAINVYSYSNSAILGFFVGYEAIGLFGIAERVMMLFKQVLSVFSQVLYPAGCKAAVISTSTYFSLLKRSYLPFMVFFMACCAVAFIYSPLIVLYFNHAENAQLSIVIRLFIVAVFFTALNIPPYQTLLSFNFQKSYSVTLTLCCITSILLNIFLSGQFGLWGTSINVLLTEILVTLSLYAVLHFRHTPYSILQRINYVRK